MHYYISMHNEYHDLLHSAKFYDQTSWCKLIMQFYCYFHAPLQIYRTVYVHRIENKTVYMQWVRSKQRWIIAKFCNLAATSCRILVSYTSSDREAFSHNLCILYSQFRRMGHVQTQSILLVNILVKDQRLCFEKNNSHGMHNKINLTLQFYCNSIILGACIWALGLCRILSM